MTEKYTALFNKNMEDTSNLAKTLKNTKAHLYDKLRSSHQNATQFIQKSDLTGLNISPKGNRVGFNATDKLRVDYRDHPGIFLNFAGSPQNTMIHN